MEKGTFDEDCETLIIRYRLEREEWQACCHDSACSNNDSNQNQTAGSLGSQSCSTAQTTIGMQYLHCPPATTTASPNWCSNSTCSNSTTSTTTLSINPFGCRQSDTRSLLTTPQPNVDLNSNSDLEIETEENRKNQNLKQRHYAQKNKNKNEQSQKKHEKSFRTTKERKRAANFVDLLFIQLGEILIHQFHSTITVDNSKHSLESKIPLPAITRSKSKKGGTNESENVHERELKVLIWKHFVQMLVAMLTDKVRFPIKSS